MKIFPLF